MLPPTTTILCVNIHSSALARATFEADLPGVVLVPAHSETEALQLLAEREVALILIDSSSGDAAWALARTIRDSEKGAQVPIVFAASTEPTEEFMRRLAAFAPADSLPATAVPTRLRAAIEKWFHGNNFGHSPSNGVHSEPVNGVRDSARSEERIQLLLAAAPDYGLFFLDGRGVIREWTTNAANLFGYSAEEAIGKGLELVYSAADRAAGVPARRLERAARDNKVTDARWYGRKDGGRFYGVSRLIALRDESGVRGFVQILRDATAQKQADLKLREALNNFQNLADNMSQLAWMADPAGNRVWFNRRWLDYTGTTNDEMRGRGWCKVIHPHYADAACHNIDAATGTTVSFEQRIPLRAKTGEYRWFLCQSTPIRAADGAVQRWVGTCTDINDDVLLRQELAQRSTQLQLAVEAAELGTFFNDEEAGVHVWNEQNKRLLGLPSNAVPSMNTFLSAIHPEDRTQVEARLRAASRARPPGRGFTLEYRVVWPDGTVHHIAARGRSFRERRRGGTIATQLIGTARDITGLRKFEQELQRQVVQRTAALQERTQQLEAFSYTVAHDLRSPLRAISGYLDIVVGEFAGNLPPEGAAYLDKIQRAAQRMDALISDLLAFSRIMQIPIVADAVSLDEVVQSVLAGLRPEIIQRKAEITVNSPLPVVRGERSVLEQIVLNLLTNALKFVANDTTPRVTISAAERDDSVAVRISDNGIGIPKAYQTRIFRVFERLDPTREHSGTGVGLAIVAKAVERLGGRIGVESAPGKGSTFWFELKKANR